MKPNITCPTCGKQSIDLCEYESMMVLREDMALFTVECPVCGTTVSTVNQIPSELREEVRCAATELGAGMGRDN